MSCGHVLCWGWGGNGQLGTNDRDSRIKPHVVEYLVHRPAVTRVVCGSRFTIAITKTGSVYAWGKNDYGQLGTGDTKAQLEPRLVEALNGISITDLACRGSHVVALASNGSVFSWGRGDDGQLGHNSRESLFLPQEIQKLKGRKVCRVAAGRSHSIAVTANGKVFSWGCNEDGALGRQSDSKNFATPMVIEALEEIEVTEIECGSRHNLCLSASNQIFSWGWGIYGQLGLGDGATRSFPTELKSLRDKHIIRICCGFRHSFAIADHLLSRSASTYIHSPLIELTENPTEPTVDIWAWGWNEYGQLGEPTSTACVLEPVKISRLSGIHLKHLAAGGRHSICSLDDPIQFLELTHGRRARSRTDPTGSGHRRHHLETLAWGRGNDGELGIGSVPNMSAPVSVQLLFGKQIEQLSCGWAHSSALVKDTTFEEALIASKSSKFEMTITLGDLDAFFGLFIQFVIQLLLLFQILPTRCGFTRTQVISQLIPSASATVLMSNLFFAFQGATLAKFEERKDVTALPDGLNTVLVFTYALSIMAPEYERTNSAQKAWEAGVFASLMTGLLQMACLPFVTTLKQRIPRAALLSSVAGVSLAFLTMGFAFEVWQDPLVALGPLMLVLICFGSGVKLPFRLPTGLGALLFGMIAACGLYKLGDLSSSFVPFAYEFHVDFFLPTPKFELMVNVLTSGDGVKFMSVIFPMVLVNVMSTIANLETASAVGDHFDPTLSILGDSVATIIGALLGNPFPTSIYIGHPIYKSMGARVGYMCLAAVAAALIGFLNGTSLILNTVPVSCGVGFLLWIGLVITASSFNRTPASNTNHGAAVALGIVPALAAWAFQLVQNAINSTRQVSQAHQPAGVAHDTEYFSDVLVALEQAGINPRGMLALSQGYLLTSIFLASMMVNIIEREFLRAASWMLIASCLSFFGIVHSFTIEDNVVQASFGMLPGGLNGWAMRYTAIYAALALLLVLFHLREGEVSVVELRDIFSKWRLRRKAKANQERMPLLGK